MLPYDFPKNHTSAALTVEFGRDETGNQGTAIEDVKLDV